MKIIFNKEQRMLYDILKRHNIDVPSYVNFRELLEATKDRNSAIEFIRHINMNDSITKEEYKFLLKIYKNNKDTYEKLLKVDFSKIKISDLKEIYDVNPKLIINLSEYPEKINKKFVDFWGEDLILEKIDYLKKIINLPENELDINIINKIKESPEKVDSLLKLNELIEKDEYLNSNLSNILASDSLDDIINIYDELLYKEETFSCNWTSLRKSVVSNASDKEYIDLCKKLTSVSGNITFPNSYDECKKRIYEISPNLLVENFNKLLICIAEDKKENSDARDFMFNAVLDLQNSKSKLFEIIKEAEKNHYELGKEWQKVKEASLLFDEKEPYEKRLISFKKHLKDGDLKIDFNELYDETKVFKSKLLKQNLLNPSDLKTIRYEHVESIDSSGNIVVKDVPVKTLDTDDFEVICHSIVAKEDNALNRNAEANIEIGGQLLNNPELWQKKMEGNPQVSVSNFRGWVNPFGGFSGVVVGISEFEDERLVSTYAGDGATSMSQSVEDTYLENQNLAFDLNENLLNAGNYPEIVLKRYLGDETIPINYVLCDSSIKGNYENTKKWASYYDVPIVEINRLAIGECRKENVKDILNDIVETDELNEVNLKKLKYELNMAKWCYEFKKEKGIDSLEIIGYLCDNIELNAENASNIMKLMQHENFIYKDTTKDYGTDDIDMGEKANNYSTSRLVYFAPIDYTEKDKTYIEEDEKSKQRRSQLEGYLSRCQDALINRQKESEKQEKEYDSYLENLREFYKGEKEDDACLCSSFTVNTENGSCLYQLEKIDENDKRVLIEKNFIYNEVFKENFLEEAIQIFGRNNSVMTSSVDSYTSELGEKANYQIISYNNNVMRINDIKKMDVSDLEKRLDRVMPKTTDSSCYGNISSK